ncbi:ATP-binding protein [Neptuniibacter sp. QD29_5]|uniref:ATP-binding protein n=1 Tax=Neptuniibacter sp. QD29_5 TaxID=3398207 RepID=UPI0039F54A6F
MLSTQVVLFSLLCYLGLLLVIAWFGQRGGETIRRMSDSPVTYTLSLAVFCTSWTFYGSVGKAATSGMSFLAVYFGPTLAMLFAGVMMRRLIHLKNDLRITSIADFLSARYFRSQQVATLVTIMASLGAVPYISLQLKAVNSSLTVLSSSAAVNIPDVIVNQLPLISAACIALFTILFGVRHLDPTERHPGIILALAFECIVKLAAFMAVGIFVCFSLFDTPQSLLELANQPEYEVTQNLSQVPSFFQWTTLLVLSASAFFFLPRQFHVAVVENSNPDHFRSAQWGFPLYILLINLFVIPIALAGLVLNYSPQQADSFVLLLPLNHGDPLLALFAFVGGISAALGMVMICAMALSTMMINHLLLPLIEQIIQLNPLRRFLLQLRWLAVIFIIIGGYLFDRLVGGSYMLVNIGLLAFAAVAQFLPATLGGLFWSKGTKLGALWGLSAGFVTWIYCLVLPTFIRSGWLDSSLLSDGFLGQSWLRPEALFNLTAVDSLSHGVFWSLAFNLMGYVLGSLLNRPSDEERTYYQQFMDKMDENSTYEESVFETSLEENIALEGKRERSLNLLNQYMVEDRAVSILREAEVKANTLGKSHCNLFALAELGRQIDQRLSGALGASIAAKVLKRAQLFTSSEFKELQIHYGNVLTELRISPAELKRKVNFYREREELVLKHNEEQAQTIDQLRQEIHLRQQAEQEKELTQKRLQLIMDFAPTIIYLITAEGRFLEVNNEFLKLFSVTKDRAVGALPSDFIAKGVAEQMMSNDSRVLQERKMLEFEETLTEGHNRTFVSVKFPIMDGDKLIGLCAISTDISVRIRLEAELKKFSAELENKVEERTSELRKANASLACTLDDLKQTQCQLVEAEKMMALASLVTGVAHEINTPIGVCVTASSSIEGELAELIAARESGQLREQLFLDFCENTEAQLQLINGNLKKACGLVQTFRKLSAHEGDTALGATDICELMADFCLAHEGGIVSAGHSLSFSCDDGQPLVITTYPVSLSAALEYLLENAVSHAFPEGYHGKISFHINRTDRGVRILYRDNGRGLSENMEQHLFEPFVTSKRFEGKVGLGNHIFYILITQKLGGTIEVKNKPDQGLEISIDLPQVCEFSPSDTTHPVLHDL